MPPMNARRKYTLLLLWSLTCLGVGGGGVYLSEQTFRSPVLQHTHEADNHLVTLLQQSRRVCFMGDSVTAGSENGGYPWYHPLAQAFPHLSVSAVAEGGCTVSRLLSLLDKASAAVYDADVYIIAIGTNDIRYRDPARCAMTAPEYIAQLRALTHRLADHRESIPRFVFVAPWYSTPEDFITPLSRLEKEQMMQEYTNALETFCRSDEHLFLNPNPALTTILNQADLRNEYLIDYIHPNPRKGCFLYSAAVMTSADTVPATGTE